MASERERGGVIEAAGVALAYRERGTGAGVLLVHGMADDARGWDATVDELAGEARVIAYDRRGYGASGAPTPYERTTVQEQAEDAAALVRRLDAASVVACGRDFGALVCLDLLRRHHSLVGAIAVFDPPVFALAPSATAALAEERRRLEESLRDEGPRAAVASFLGDHADLDRVERARSAAGAFFADYGGLASWPVTRRELRELDVALAVVTSSDAPFHAIEAADALAKLVPGSRREHGDRPVDIVRELLEATA